MTTYTCTNPDCGAVCWLTGDEEPEACTECGGEVEEVEDEP